MTKTVRYEVITEIVRNIDCDCVDLEKMASILEELVEDAKLRCGSEESEW